MQNQIMQLSSMTSLESSHYMKHQIQKKIKIKRKSSIKQERPPNTIACSRINTMYKCSASKW
ncbi:hypothetical protein Hanom_Chr15g01384671 [Helianthus anomalus]